MQNRGSVHETPANALPRELGLGLGTTAQADPFQDSLSVCTMPDASVYEPTAMQKVDVGHETLVSVFDPSPLLGLGIADHCVSATARPEGPSVMAVSAVASTTKDSKKRRDDSVNRPGFHRGSVVWETASAAGGI